MPNLEAKINGSAEGKPGKESSALDKLTSNLVFSKTLKQEDDHGTIINTRKNSLPPDNNKKLKIVTGATKNSSIAASSPPRASAANNMRL